MPQPATFIPLDGRLTSLEPLSIDLTADSVMEVVAPGDPATGNNFKVTLAQLAAYVSVLPYLDTTIITSGATLASPYHILVTDTRILFNKTVASASYAVAPLAASMASPFPLFIKDLKGNADTYPIQISFTGGELCDGLSTITIGNPYGWTTINPVPAGGAWYQS